jgi:amino acid adenylation domain-containing protein
VLATWSLGAAYLPLDPAQPPSRRHDLLARGGARVVLAHPTASGGQTDAASGPPLVAVPAGQAVPDPPRDTAALLAGLTGVSPDDLAYVIFTSGSTGRPKGVEITHRALGNLVRHFARELTTAVGDRVLWSTTFGFDISALEFALGLCHGGGVVVAPDEALVRPAVLLDLVSRHDVAVVQATPTIWRLVAAELRNELRGRTVLCGGELLSAALARRLLTSGCRLYNVYGPTETTIWSTATPITPEVTDPVGIGGPIAETALYVIDEYGQDAPPGVVGELCVAGTGLARGYAGAPELTAQRFPVDPRRGRYYRTGDLATWRTDGTVTLLGRVDRQVKLRGRRIELGEIEAVLEQHPAVAAAAVVVVGDPQGDGRLVGYLQPVGAAADRLDLDDVRRHTSATLPYFLLPAELAVLPALPRNANGKVDYRALPEIATPAAGGAGPVTPDDPLVGRLLALWRDLLGAAGLAADANFFVHGGHSLLAAILATRVGEELGLPVSLLDVFHAPTPVELAALLRERTGRDDIASPGEGRTVAEVIT